MANGPATNEGTRPQPGGTVAQIVSFPPAQIVERLYRAALVRPPQPSELKRGEKFLQASLRLAKTESTERANQEGTIQETPQEEDKSAAPTSGSIGDRAGDLLWALLNSAEFRYNH